MQELAQIVHVSAFPVTPQHLRGTGRRTRARIEKRDVNFASRERLIENREVADYNCQQAKSICRFNHGKRATHLQRRRNITITQRTGGDTAQVEVCSERWVRI